MIKGSRVVLRLIQDKDWPIMEEWGKVERRSGGHFKSRTKRNDTQYAGFDR